MQVTRFPSRADGLSDRMSGFIAHLRMNGLRVGPRETGDALAALTAVNATDVRQARQALRAVLAGDSEDWRRFDDLFDAYWFNMGKQRKGAAQTSHVRVQTAKPMIWQQNDQTEKGANSDTDQKATADPRDRSATGIDGKLVATRQADLSRQDLRELLDEQSLLQAEKAAIAIARAIRDRRSRRRKQALRGPALDIRRIQRASLARGGEPIDLFHRARPPRPMKIVALCDVSGSMTVYSRVFLAFLKGLISSGTQADTYLFHTRLMRVTDALRDHDTLRAAGRLSLMAEGFGGGTDISGSLNTFLTGYGARALNGRTIVLILSDGYCSSDPKALGDVLARIRRKARRIVWLNPLKGWRDYQPIAAAMQEAKPYLDAHLPANTLEALAALEPQFRKL
ncbi:vWA domain-containing protein [Ruegeria profundi]|uniref:Carbon monoxide dehydrogenase n=1 Tax=Ruegeria profundi TaxID=1685378 RepID=A0A0X3TNP3_9RHOB|nr:VWA domain-containing protein [Ruegeria profundi]KUJ76631.1 carbon monoxide dehydrogenase [Ruegeria profundi]